MPINLDNYHPKWTLISRLIRKRANNCCEQCGVENGRIIARAEDRFRYVTDKELEQVDLLRKNGSTYWGSLKALGFTRVILTTAHLDRNTGNNRFSNLKAFCQRCHFKYDWPANEMAKRYGKNDETLSLFQS